jgi:hypothetical protein
MYMVSEFARGVKHGMCVIPVFLKVFYGCNSIPLRDL